MADCGKYEAELDGELAQGKLTLAELDEEEQSLDRLRRWYRAIRARDLFGAPSAPLAERRLKECAETLERFAEQVYAAFLAGTSKMQWRKFVVANAAGGIVWAGLWTLAAYLAGNALKRASGTINLIFIGAAVVAIVIAILLVRQRTSKLADRAEEAYPGPLE